jgi:hypothetical protein
MTSIKIADLPPIAHHMNIIILAAQLENWHRNVVRQELDPAIAREMAIQYSMEPQDTQQQMMVEQAWRVTIRLFKAMDDLGLKHDKRRVAVDNLIFMGLK